jgi:hypothetical protein
MSKDSNSKKKLDDEGWLDEPSNRKKLIRWFYLLCGLIILADLIFTFGWHKHAAFAEENPFYSIETLPAFYGIFGFGAGIAVIYLSKIIRSWSGKKILMRSEDYWEKK